MRTVHAEIKFQLRSGTRSLAQQGGEALVPALGRLPRITQVLALAIYFDDMIRKGDATDYADLARLGGLCRERVSQIMRLNYLAPDIQVELLYLPPIHTGRYAIRETAMRKVANLLSWAEQREQWTRLKQVHFLAKDGPALR